jgi:hypothetical protein
VQVTNNDSEAHPVTADSGQDFDTTVQPGKTASFAAPKQAGSYRSHRNLHSKHAWHPDGDRLTVRSGVQVGAPMGITCSDGRRCPTDGVFDAGSR